MQTAGQVGCNFAASTPALRRCRVLAVLRISKPVVEATLQAGETLEP